MTVILQKARATEKIVKMIEAENVLCFETDRKFSKMDIKNEVESLFDVKVAGVRVHIRKNKKLAYVKLKPEFVAADIATTIGVL